MDAKKENGDSYETSTVHSLFSILGRHLKDAHVGDLETDREFQGARDVKKAKVKLLKAEGKGNRANRASALTKEEEETLFEKDSLDSAHQRLFSELCGG